MALRFSLIAFSVAFCFAYLTGCGAFAPKTCVQGPEYAKEQLLAFFADYSEQIENGRFDPKNWSFDPRLGAMVNPEDIQLLENVVETEPGWYAFDFTVPTIEGMEFSVLTNPDCYSEVQFGEVRKAQFVH